MSRAVVGTALLALGAGALPPALVGQSASLRSDPPPPPPQNVAAVPQSPTEILVTWDDVEDWHDDDDVEEYRVYRDGTLVGSPSGTSYRDRGLQPNTTYRYEISAVSEDDDKEGARSQPVTATTPPLPDTSPPTAPSGLQASASAPDQVDLSWQPASDPESGVASYRVYRNGAVVASPTGTSFSDTGLQAQTTYSYRVSAVNGAGLEGNASATVSVTTPATGDTSPPTAPSGLQASASAPDQVDLSWQPASDPESGVASYRVYRNGAVVASPTGTNFSDTGLQPQTTYSYRVSAVNGAGLEGSPSATVSVTTPATGDTSPPTAPSGLQADAIGIGRIDLAWQAASDPESGISTYRVYRDGAFVASTSATTFSDGGLQPQTTYTYEVSAVNGAGLEGGRSAPASASTAARGDTSPPSAPGALQADAEGARRVALAWQAASDPESGVASYRVYRDGTRVAAVDTPSYTDTDVEPSTAYTYRVTAVNGDGMEGGASQPASVTTPAEADTVPPAAPTGLRIVPPP